MNDVESNYVPHPFLRLAAESVSAAIEDIVENLSKQPQESEVEK